MTPSELLYHAKAVGLQGISITDHDTIEAYTTAPQIAKELGLLLGNGVEFSSYFQNFSVHILGYDFDLSSPEIQKLCERHQNRRVKRNKSILEKLSRLSMPLLEEELLAMGERSIGRPHIAKLMIQKGYVSTIKEAFNLYLGDGRPCFDSGEVVSSEETIAVIHQGGGKAFVAHPHLLEHANYIKKLLKLPFDGLECYYGRFSLEQEKRWLKIAQEREWLISGGSDFHGPSKEYIQLGCAWVGEEHFHKIFQRHTESDSKVSPGLRQSPTDR
jgi:predicted metal-dependent phosphoesterase TrpH